MEYFRKRDIEKDKKSDRSIFERRPSAIGDQVTILMRDMYGDIQGKNVLQAFWCTYCDDINALTDRGRVRLVQFYDAEELVFDVYFKEKKAREEKLWGKLILDKSDRTGSSYVDEVSSRFSQISNFSSRSVTEMDSSEAADAGFY